MRDVARRLLGHPLPIPPAHALAPPEAMSAALFAGWPAWAWRGINGHVSGSSGAHPPRRPAIGARAAQFDSCLGCIASSPSCSTVPAPGSEHPCRPETKPIPWHHPRFTLIALLISRPLSNLRSWIGPCREVALALYNCPVAGGGAVTLTNRAASQRLPPVACPVGLWPSAPGKDELSPTRLAAASQPPRP
ncbi:hypothetical protein ACCO45_003398 [Purpureocillium lilacinum]|uniref:Uncharacterized protein n=1 Tax=Purpureocillium lilacinum TaxID=33203 RepID=A0ACC4DZR6_PURLI